VHNRSQSAIVCVLAVLAVVTLPAQEREDRTLLPWEQMRAIINEASGDRAMHHLLELVPYPRVRPVSEYTGHFRESETMARFAREYGFSDVRIESFPTQNRLWQPTQGELWLTEPEPRKLYDIQSVAVSLAANSAPGDVTAELVDIGTGSDEVLDAKDLKGKIVLSSSGLGALSRAVQRGAIGIIGIAALRPDDYPDQILSSSVNPPAGSNAFGWAVSPRVGRELAARLARGQTVVLRSVVKAEYFPGELEIVHATIPGDGSTDQEVFVSAHLYEGYIKQGANDDNSGCALTLEMGRT
jgi:aminopeptidase YwaD